MNGDVCVVSQKELLKSMRRDISDKTGIPEGELANMSPIELNKRLGITEVDLPGVRYIFGIIPVRYDPAAYFRERREEVDRWLDKISSAYYRKHGRERNYI